MSEIENSIREIVDRIWIEGRNAGLSDHDIIQIIETKLQEKVKAKDRTPRNKYNYTPMTDEEIKASQRKINETSSANPPLRTKTSSVFQIREEPQVLYAPPKQEEVHYVEREMPQPLYAPPQQEIHYVEEMPQPLYAPPQQEIHYVEEMPQPLYAPPRAEIDEMFIDESQESDNKPKKNKM